MLFLDEVVVIYFLQFILGNRVDVYADMAARDAHLQTEHFLKWKDDYLATQERKGDGNEFIAIYPVEGEWEKHS